MLSNGIRRQYSSLRTVGEERRLNPGSHYEQAHGQKKYSWYAFQRISSYQWSRSRDRLMQLGTRFVTLQTWARTLIVLHVVPGFLRSCGVFSHDVVIHESLSSKQREAPRTTQHTADHVFCCLLQPMSDSVLKHLIPHHRPCSKERRDTWTIMPNKFHRLVFKLASEWWQRLFW